MVDFTSYDFLKEFLVLTKIMHAMIGVYIWEWLISFDFDWQFVTRKRPFQWPMIIYFLNRYFRLFSVIGAAIMVNETEEINCQVLYTFTVVLGNAAMGLSSISLALRTMAVWAMQPYIVVPLIVILLGHWSILLNGLVMKAAWLPGQGCVITDINMPILVATFIYTMAFDLIVMLLMAVKLFKTNTGSRSRLASLIFGDGLIYFIVSFLSNLMASTFMLLDLSFVMRTIGNVPAAIITTIAACRVARRLNNYSTGSVEIFSSNQPSIPLAFRSPSEVTPQVLNKSSKGGIHAQVETFQFPAKDTSNSYDSESQVHRESKPASL